MKEEGEGSEEVISDQLEAAAFAIFRYGVTGGGKRRKN
jgi:hypothetical protein